MRPFRNRSEAGRALAERLRGYAEERPIVLALPRGGVPVAWEVAQALHAPLDVLVVRKLGAPFQPELGVGALVEDGTLFIDEEACDSLGISLDELSEIARREHLEMARRVARYRGGRPLPELRDRTVIVVDDGIATGGSARAAIRALRAYGPRRIVLATPVAAVQTLEILGAEADDLVTVIATAQLVAIGGWYQDFHQIGDAEVQALLTDPGS